MIRLAFSAFTWLCLLASLFLLFQSGAFAGRMPDGLAGWIAAYFALFREPVPAAALLALSGSLALVSACVTELLLGLVFAASAAAVSLACLLGFLGAHYPPLAQAMESWFR